MGTDCGSFIFQAELSTCVGLLIKFLCRDFLRIYINVDLYVF